MAIKTKAIVGQYKGHATLQIVDVDDKGEQIGKPFSFGVKKAKAILDNLPEIERFVKNYSSTAASNINVAELSPEQKNELLTALLAT